MFLSKHQQFAYSLINLAKLTCFSSFVTMCGIAGIHHFNNKSLDFKLPLQKAAQNLNKRGPDHTGFYYSEKVSFAHARLSIIDTSNAANQPFTDKSGRYTLVFNGEVFNFKSLKKELENKGITFSTESDTEVLLYLFIEEKIACLNKLNGFFSFAFHDNKTQETFIVRDRFGVKPLVYFLDEEKIIFGSEIKAILPFGIKKEISEDALHFYFQLNYIPHPLTIFKGINKLEPGQYIFISKDNKVTIDNYYKLEYSNNSVKFNDYSKAKNYFRDLLTDAVNKRLIADVPLGCFLSGGIDSSVITALAAKEVKNLRTFSIGFKDEPFFDETRFAELVAKKHNTNHTVFSLTTNELYESLHSALSYMDEPFADSSALAVNILSEYTAKKVTAILSGDGADELFAGYNKHKAEYTILQNSWKNSLIKTAHPVLKTLPQSRNSSTGNFFRKVNKYAEGLRMTSSNRYWRWASYCNEEDVDSLLKNKTFVNYKKLKSGFINPESKDLNNFLLKDVNLVLPNDMLTKVDWMSMNNSLEVRTPFLDYRVVEFAFSIPASFKIDAKSQKKILKDTFSDELPHELLHRNKQGFEVPLLKWFKGDLKSWIENDLLSKKFVEEQNIFNYSEIKTILKQLNSASPGDSVARVWALIVFQNWYKNYFINA
ncbi:MAG: asparagine synthase (glutamine-hydrolyzing) [Bacteroidota bacterium]